MLYIVNDLHGAKKLIDQTLAAMDKMNPRDTLIINGDGAGARGPIMNQIVKVFYEVRRGETNISVLYEEIEKVIHEKPQIPRAWIYDSVHAGVFRKLMANRYQLFDACMKQESKDVLEETLRPLAEKATKCGIRIIYLPGNGEIVPDDFIVDDITTEQTVEPEQRFYQKLAREGYFDQFEVEYVEYHRFLPDGVLLLSTHLLDMDDDELEEYCRNMGIYKRSYSKVLVHYPPEIAPVGGAFDFWTPNKSDVQRSETLGRVLAKLSLSDDALVYFGHIHLGANDARMDRYPSSMTFLTNGFSGCVWVKPGTVIKI